MCIAIYKLSGNELPTKEKLQNCFRANPDGAGFSYSYKGTVYTYKGFFNFDEFYNKLIDCNKRYKLKEQGVLIHCRISTHGLTNASNCHPFALTNNEHKLTATFTKSQYSVIHNGICSVTSSAKKNEPLSDTARFVRDYLSKIATYKDWFYNPHTIKFIEQLIDSKMAILRSDGEIIATSGFHKANDGNYYSNRSYEDYYGGIYGYGFYDDWYSEYFNKDAKYEMPLMELKRGETIYYDDGTVEEYRSDYHKTFKTYVTEDYEVYTLFEEGEFGKKIPMEKLSYIGNGEIIDNFFSIADTGIKVAAFRQDAVAVI